MNTQELVNHCALSWHINTALFQHIRNITYNVKELPFIKEMNGAGIILDKGVMFGTGYHGTKIVPELGYTSRIADPKKIGVLETTTLGRMLRKAIPETVKDDAIRSLVEEFKTMIDPKFFEKHIVLPKTVEQYFKMFDMNNGSCLQARSNYYGAEVTAQWAKFEKEHSLHPGAWLLYNPCLQGVMMLDDKGNTVARCVVYLEDDVPVAMDTPKGIGTYATQMYALLSKHLIKKPTKAENLWRNIKPFVIDGFMLKGDTDVYFPWPTLDNPVVLDGMYCAYNPETRKLHVAVDANDPSLQKLPAKAAGYRYRYQGFMKASEYANFVAVDPSSTARAA